MLRKTLPTYIPHATMLLLMATVLTSSAQQQQQQDKEPASGNALSAQLVKTGLFVISGGGCNSVLRLSGNGFILVDGKLPGNYEAILALSKKLSYSEQPIRALIVTDHLENHNGNNAEFLAGGTQILAQENAKQNLKSHSPAGAKAALPTITYDHDYMLRLGGVEAQLLHFGNAHTSGDTVVYFPNLKVVAVGDLFASMPDPDFSAGGSLVGWGAVLAEILKLDFDVVVPGTGPGVRRADLEAFKAKVDTVVFRAAKLVKEGVSKDQLMAKLRTDDLGWRFDFTADRVDRFYAELSRPK